MGKIVCGIDLGGTKINTGLVDENGKVLYNVKVPTLAQEGPEAVVKRIVKSVHDLLKESGVELKDISGIGVGSPGPLDVERGIIMSPSNLPGWNNVPLVDILKKEFKINTKLNNDANAAALGEYFFGAGRGIKDFIYMTVSTGIGGGIIIDGRLYNGVSSNAGEIGHATINFNGPKCNCGNIGCFEVYASGTAVGRFAREALSSGEDSIMKTMAPISEIKSEHVFEAARMGDRLALKLIDMEGYYLGVGITNLIACYNPQMIAIGGGVGSQLEMYYDKMYETLNKLCLAPSLRDCRIVKAELGGDLGLIGAAALVF
jgi:glucokinase